MEKLKNYKVDNVYYSEYFDKETNRTYIGKTICHEEDKDFESDKIGYTISTNRAIEKYYKGLKKKLIQENHTLTTLLNTYKSTPDYDETNRFIRILRKKIYNNNEDIKLLKEAIKDINTSTKRYIDDKDNYHKQLRKLRLTKNN